MRKDNLRILVVDDSAVVRSFLKNILQLDKNIQVVGMACNGLEAIDMARDLKPDLITMDINMPVMGGFEATKRIMQENPAPIVIVSGNYSPSDVSMTFESLKSGAVNILPKPAGIGSPDFEKSTIKFRQMIWLMSEIKVVRKYASEAEGVKIDNKQEKTVAKDKTSLVCIGASAGGPLILQKILKDLPKDIPFPVLIVQHVDAGFAEGFASWLRETTNQNVKVASNGECIENGCIYLAPGDSHIGIRNDDTLMVSKSEPIHGCRPSVSFLFRTVLAFGAKRTVNILLSGMGKDGALEMKELKDAGAITIAQSKETSLVHGMPGEAIKLGGACKVMAPTEIHNYIKSLF